MTNFQVYKKTLSFSFVSFLVELLLLVIVGGLTYLGFIIFNSFNANGVLGVTVGLIIGIIIAILVNIFFTNRVKAAQIAMMSKGVVDNKIEDSSFKAGMQEVKGRFGKITVFFIITGAIKGILRQIGNAINKVGKAIGGDAGDAVTSSINAAIEILIGYLSDCCLGWILYREDINSFKAGCEGAVIFFKHGKTLARNAGRIFGIGFLSLLLIGGSFFGISYLISLQIPDIYNNLAIEIGKISTDIPSFMTDPKVLMLVGSGVVALIMFSIPHSVLIRPFVLVGVLRNFMAAGINDIPTEADFSSLESKSSKFAKLRSRFE